jgi:hypothetical protein
MGLPLRSPVAKLSCEAATEENAKRRSFMPRTQVTGKANFSPGITSGLPVRTKPLGNNRQSDKADRISGLPILAPSDFGPSRWPLRPLL